MKFQSELKGNVEQKKEKKIFKNISTSRRIEIAFLLVIFKAFHNV
jgi:hypothetical protein